MQGQLFSMFVLMVWQLWKNAAEERHRLVHAYSGYVFNISVASPTKTQLPEWLFWERDALIGLPLESDISQQLLISVNKHLQLRIKTESLRPWWKGFFDNPQSQRAQFSDLFVAGLVVNKQKFFSLSIKNKISLIQRVKTLLNLTSVQKVVVVSLKSVSKSVAFVTQSGKVNNMNQFVVLTWCVGEGLVSNISLQTLQKFERQFLKETVTINYKLIVHSWFVGFIRPYPVQIRQHHKRSIKAIEYSTLVESSGNSNSIRANDFVIKTEKISNVSRPDVANRTKSSSAKPIISNNLLPIKIHALQIMNYQIPENTFVDLDFKSELKLKVFHQDDTPISDDPTQWISFSPKEQNIRISPKLSNVGQTVLKVCAFNLVWNSACDNLTISVSAPPPQNHQIYTYKTDKDYVINYTIPTAWFQRFGVRNRTDVFIEKATGNSPFDWTNNGELQILNIASLEGKLIEMNLAVIIKNESRILIHLTLPVVAINRYKIASGPLYQSTFRFNAASDADGKQNYHLQDIWQLFRSLESFIKILMPNFDIKVQILSPLICPAFYDKRPGTVNDILQFTWFFSTSSPSSSNKFCQMELLNHVHLQFSNLTLSSFVIVETTKLEERFGRVCVPPNVEYSTSKMSEITTSLSILLVESKMKEEAQTIQEMFPNFQYSNFTVTAGLPFKSYVFRKHSFGRNLINEMRLETSSDIGTEPWIALSAGNDYLFGLPLNSHVRANPYQFRFIIKLQHSFTQFKVSFLVNVIKYDSDKPKVNHRIQISIQADSQIKTNMQFRWRLVTQLDKYIRDNCEAANDCGKDLALLDFQASSNSSTQFVFAVVSFRSLLAIDDSHCPKLSLIRLYEKFINTAGTSNHENVPNFGLKYLFSTCGLGEIEKVSLNLSGICDGIKLQPPDIGQVSVFAMIPFYRSLRQLRLFYNTTVWFTINSRDSGRRENQYHDWIAVNEDSTALVGVANHKHARPEPYLLELIVHSNTIHQIISPRIAVVVQKLKDHVYFTPYFHQPNHQIVIAIKPLLTLKPKKNMLLFKFLFFSQLDQYLRADCIKNMYVSSSTLIQPCGSNVLYQSISLTENPENIIFKFSMLSALSISKSSLVKSNSGLNSHEKHCPVDDLQNIKRNLVSENGIPNRISILPKLYNYFYKSNTGQISDAKFEFIGSCSKYQHDIQRTENLQQGLMKSPMTVSDDDNRQMFLIATIIPTCSFVIISLCVGLLVACCLQKRSEKYSLQRNDHETAVPITVRGGTSPIILAGEYPHPYLPPSRPLILPNEKPPISPPDYIAENNTVIFNHEEC